MSRAAHAPGGFDQCYVEAQAARASPAATQPQPPQPVRGIMLTARDLGSIDIAGRFFYVGGEVRDAVVTPVGPFPGPRSDMPQPALELTSISMKGGGRTEFWTDVSLLTLPAAEDDPDAFDFDWFFTGGGASQRLKPSRRTRCAIWSRHRPESLPCRPRSGSKTREHVAGDCRRGLPSRALSSLLMRSAPPNDRAGQKPSVGLNISGLVYKQTAFCSA